MEKLVAGLGVLIASIFMLLAIVFSRSLIIGSLIGICIALFGLFFIED